MPVDCLLDCSLGVNQSPFPEAILKLLELTPQSLIKQYPHHEGVIGAIVDIYASIAAISAENICIGNGSYDLLQGINLLYLAPGKTVFSCVPHFSAYTDHIRCLGARHVHRALRADENYRFDTAGFITEMRKSGADLVFLENPNNPTGQTLTSAETAEIIKEAERMEAAVIVDEAYGDYIDLSRSAVAHTGRHKNLFVTRSLSKGYGMAGIRFGYSAAAPYATTQLKKIITPFNCNAHARRLAEEIFRIGDYQQALIERTREKKKILLSFLRENPVIRYAHTDESTPVMLLYTEDWAVDLHKVLLEAGIASVSGRNFDGIGQNAVRIMIPEDTALLMSLLKGVADKLKANQS
jgi:histidinol-phosphate aminotransferase